MALVLKDRIKETSTTAGTGTLTLSGAVSGFQSFSVLGNGNITYYAISDAASGDWEVGYGTYNAGTLTRTFVYDSSNAGALVTFGPTAKDVFCTYPAEQAIYQETNGSLRLVGGTIGLTEDGTEGTTLPNTSFQAFTTGNYYMQANQQNLSSGAEASSDYVVTADNGNDTENYIDMGMASSGYNYAGFSAFKANSGYLVSTGSDLRLIAGKFGAVTPGAQDIVFVAGSLLDSEERMRIKGATGNLILDGNNPSDTGEKLQVVGSAKVTGAATFGSTVTLNADPTANLQAATKQYVDASASTSFVVHTPVRVVANTYTGTNSTYNNGTAGVGATLTSTVNGALSIDGVSPSAGDRVLLRALSTASHNGVYTVTDAGSPSTVWVLTRATDFDQAAAGEIANNAYFFVTAGTTYRGYSYVLSQTAAITVGTTALPFSEFASQTAYTGTGNIDVTGTVISLTGTVGVTNGGTGLASYTSGDMVYASATTTLSALPIGTTGQVLVSTGSLPQWGTLDMAGAGVSGVLPESHGGTNQSSYATGDTLYASATNTLGKLAGNTTTTKKFLTQTGTGAASAAPVWGTIAGSDVSGNISGQAGSVANALTAGTYLTSGGTYDGSVARTFAVDATSANTASKVVARDASGNFSAGTITAALSGNATTATTATNVAGGAANRLVYNTGSGTTGFVTAPTTSSTYLYWNGSAMAWGAVAQETPILENNQVISSNYAITSGKNGLSVGPVTVNSGVTVTVGSGQRWLVL